MSYATGRAGGVSAFAQVSGSFVREQLRAPLTLVPLVAARTGASPGRPRLELTPETPGASEFTCGMEMLHGQLIVTASQQASTPGEGHAGHEPSGSHGGQHAHGGGGCCGGHS